MKKTLLSGLALWIACATLPSNDALAQSNAFQTPSHNIACAVYGQNLRCDLRQNLAKLPPRPQDCELDWGNAFEMTLTGKPSRVCAGDFIGGENDPVLEYGRTWDYQGFQCRSETNGITCTNKSNHGWFIKKAEQRLY